MIFDSGANGRYGTLVAESVLKISLIGIVGIITKDRASCKIHNLAIF